MLKSIRHKFIEVIDFNEQCISTPEILRYIRNSIEIVVKYYEMLSFCLQGRKGDNRPSLRLLFLGLDG